MDEIRERTQEEWEHILCRHSGSRAHRFGQEQSMDVGPNRCVYCDLTVAMLNAGRR